MGSLSGDSSGALEAVLADVRTRIHRVGPEEAARIQSDGGLLIDTRPSEQRADEGVIPGALAIDRNVLEWRLDPTGPHRHPDAGPPGRELVVFCQEGYASSLAAASLIRGSGWRLSPTSREASLRGKHPGSRFYPALDLDICLKSPTLATLPHHAVVRRLRASRRAGSLIVGATCCRRLIVSAVEHPSRAIADRNRPASETPGR